MRVQKTVQVNKGAQAVYDYLKITKNQDNFSIWNMTDPNMKRQYQGEDGQVGFIYSWDSTNKNVGAGAQEIKKLTEGKRVDYEIRFERPMKSVAQAAFVIDKVSDKETAITWSFDSPSRGIMALFAPIFKLMLGGQMKKSLNNLKTILDKA